MDSKNEAYFYTKIKQSTKKQTHTLSIFSNTSTVEGFACLQGKEQRY